MQGRSVVVRELLDSAALCAHLVPEGSVHAFLADHRRVLFPVDLFADRSPTKRGRPWVAARWCSGSLALRCRIILAGADPELSRQEIADRVGCNPATVTKWRNRFRSECRTPRDRALVGQWARCCRTGGAIRAARQVSRQRACCSRRAVMVIRSVRVWMERMAAVRMVLASLPTHPPVRAWSSAVCLARVPGVCL